MKQKECRSLVPVMTSPQIGPPTQLVPQLATHDDNHASVEGKTPEKPPKVNLLTEVRELKAELAAIRESMEQQSRASPNPQYNPVEQGRVRPRGCWNFCQREHWEKHKKLCQAISEVELRERGPKAGVETLKTSFPSHLTPRQRSKLTKLVGRKCVVSCLVQDRKVDALWDTGAQVCVVSKYWKEINLPNEPVRDISELLGEDELNLQAVNGTKIAYDGWIEVEFQLTGEDGYSEPLTVPILIGNEDNQEYPIIGFNVIEEVIKRSSSPNKTSL
ncbi:hypothetical protein ACROYT_G037503 [Oculina patagonica]